MSATSVATAIPETPDRASASDRAFLAMDRVRHPQQFGVVLRLAAGTGPDLERMRALLAERIASVPRLRRRLVSAPWRAGGPLWADDPGFDVRGHVHHVHRPGRGTESDLMDLAWRTTASRLPRDAPLWSALLVTGLADGTSALVVVLHHALADGVGALAVLAAIVDPGHGPADPGFPRPVPAPDVLRADAAHRRRRAVRDLPRTARLLRSGMAAAGGLRPPRAQPCSLLARTGTRRRVLVVHVDLPTLRRAVHARGATVNDALLVAVAAGLQRVLAGRGDGVRTIVVAVPVSGRAAERRTDLGNLTAPLLVAVPTIGAPERRLAAVGAQVRAGRAAAGGPPPIAVLGPVFRPLARLGGFGLYMRHQHRTHTLVSHVRGPDQPVRVDGTRVTAAVPVVAGDDDDLTVRVQALSYADRLAVTAVVDPDAFPDAERFVTALQDEFRALSDT